MLAVPVIAFWSETAAVVLGGGLRTFADEGKANKLQCGDQIDLTNTWPRHRFEANEIPFLRTRTSWTLSKFGGN
jgi:hypothetical protein